MSTCRSLLTHEPSTGLGIWVVGNAAGSAASDLGATINDIMYPAFRTLLAEATRPSPPRAAEFISAYTGYVPSLLSNMTITVSRGEGEPLTAVFKWDGGGPLPANLYAGNDTSSAVLEMSPSLPIPCIFVSELAWNGEVAHFDTAAGILTMPGLLTGAVFRRNPVQPLPGPTPPPSPPTPPPSPPACPIHGGSSDVALSNGQVRALAVGCTALGAVLASVVMCTYRRFCTTSSTRGNYQVVEEHEYDLD